MTKQYICIESWARNKKGDIIERYLYNKYPAEVQAKNFKLLEKPAPVVSSKPFKASAVSASENK